MNSWQEEFEYRFHSAKENFKDLLWCLPLAVLIAVIVSAIIMASA